MCRIVFFLSKKAGVNFCVEGVKSSGMFGRHTKYNQIINIKQLVTAFHFTGRQWNALEGNPSGAFPKPSSDMQPTGMPCSPYVARPTGEWAKQRLPAPSSNLPVRLFSEQPLKTKGYVCFVGVHSVHSSIQTGRHTNIFLEA